MRLVCIAGYCRNFSFNLEQYQINVQSSQCACMRTFKVLESGCNRSIIRVAPVLLSRIRTIFTISVLLVSTFEPKSNQSTNGLISVCSMNENAIRYT